MKLHVMYTRVPARDSGTIQILAVIVIVTVKK